MRSFAAILSLACLALFAAPSTASVFLPKSLTATPTGVNARSARASADLNAARRRRMATPGKNGSASLAMAIPGYGIAEQVFVGGFSNFLQVYNLVITARILLSWFPQAQGIGLLQPVFAITDPYLNLFRGLIPPIFGLDLSPLLAFFTLNVLTSSTAAIGCEIPKDLKLKMNEKKTKMGRRFAGL